ncbi:MAG: hypothetical protein H6793_00620 [Candidatus Nomurabacteria bacterium]|nr:hypothetical protein [Candidatus Saccharibacteria bacterium]USN95660.1 MAG: hypothetical protein H6793_00620 [Candidatus Nomurabacteria bacterium]
MMDRAQFIERCDEVLSLSIDGATTENNRLIEQGRYPVLTIVGRTAGLPSIFWREAIHRLEDSDIIGSRILGDTETCVRGIAVWRETKES